MRKQLKSINLAPPDAIVELHLSDKHIDAILKLFKDTIPEKRAKSLDQYYDGYNQALDDILNELT